MVHLLVLLVVFIYVFPEKYRLETITILLYRNGQIILKIYIDINWNSTRSITFPHQAEAVTRCQVDHIITSLRVFYMSITIAQVYIYIRLIIHYPPIHYYVGRTHISFETMRITIYYCIVCGSCALETNRILCILYYICIMYKLYLYLFSILLFLRSTVVHGSS